MRVVSILSYVLVFVAVDFLVSFLTYPLVMRSVPATRIEYFMSSIIFSELSGFLTFFYLIKRRGITLREIGFTNTRSPLPFMLTLIIALAYSGLELQIPSVGEYAFQLNDLKVIAVLTAVVAGFVEEIVFRGFVVTLTREKGVLRSTLLSACLFGLAHLEWGFGGVLGTFLLGLGMAYVMYSGRSVIPCIIGICS
ncbi:CPBP family intramembrane glutamic endopeptidase [Metallosphaera hakonensis]|uniref:CPBP family intramembrane glutamic endopeptidase n=1 Tax=Metallosphaera hakonensis TaxID=79601 RepID=UPI0006D1B199|nr:CPBP family intramembrane glutamic endopeptidase [Metallosphaera hakonensis]